ncbi:MAG: hypothetical protein K2H20_02630, partial [Bacilli bacterium]|nr:hypothetical protein [Bacilli bacterium]
INGFPTFDELYYNNEKFNGVNEIHGLKYSELQWQEWSDDALNTLLDDIKTVLDLNENSVEWESFFETLDKILKTTISGYECIKNEEKIKSISENINAQLEDYRNALNNSEFKEGFVKHSDGIHYVKAYEPDPELRGRLWVYDEKTQQMVLEYIDGVDNRSRYKDDKDEKDGKFLGNDWSNEGANRLNKYRYDQEYHFFKVLKQKDPIVFDNLMQKLQYFNPAYHSMTPEGFSARLTFLQQCTRQGDTSTATDKNPKSANNLAFGRPPFCVLRLGDFYNQMIVIDNISINYDPLVWDLNTEGIGVIPLIANVSISFTFIGGGSMYGPVQRLQNAMSFNYYANSNLYDNRSDSPRYNWDVKTNGALDHSLQENSYFHTVQTYNKNK